jgi:glutamine amidotransferase
MHLLAHCSEEGNKPGLGLLPAEVRRLKLPNDRVQRLPHMGWNKVSVCSNNPVVGHLAPDARFYFLHSYYMHCLQSENIRATSFFGSAFPAVVGRDNIWGVQFHPERSHQYGLALLKNFSELHANTPNHSLSVDR